MAQPTVVAQRELIVETAGRLVGGHAELWLAGPLRRLPGSEKSLSLPSETPSDLMRRALDTRRISPSGEAELSAALAVAIPLIARDTLLGVLEVQRADGPPFRDAEIELLDALAAQSASALQAARQVGVERWQRQVADRLRDATGLLSADVGLEQVLGGILIELERTLPCDVAAVWLLHDGNLCLSAVHGCAAAVSTGDLLPDAGPWLTHALRADRPVIRNPQSPSEPLRAALGFPPDYSAIAAPLRAGDRRLGVLALAHRSPGCYGAESRAMMSAFASHAVVAIENVRLYQAAQEQAWVSTAMLQVAEATQSLTSLHQVLQAVVRLAPMLVGADRCAILLWDERAGGFVPGAAYGLDPAQQAAFDRWRVAPGDVPAFDLLRLDKAPIAIQDVATDPRLAGSGVPAFGFGALLLLPLLARGKVVGAMLFDCRNAPAGSGATGVFDNKRVPIVQGIAHQTAAAVDNARLLEAQQEEAYVSAALLQVAQAVVSSSNLNDVLGTIVRIVPMLVGVSRCIVFLWDDERSFFRPAQAYGVPRDAEATLLGRRYAPGGFPLLDAVRERDCLIVHSVGGSSDSSTEEGELIPPDFAAGFQGSQQVGSCSLLAVPLSVKGDVLGVMVLEEAKTAHRSRERRLEIIAGIGHQAALAVQNDRVQQEMAERERLERELQLAHEIQQAFMPSRSPDLPGWELAFTWRAARQVAGDFYDFFELPDRRLGLVIADVADKGMPAALFMALTRTLMRAAALEKASPAAVLARANDLLVPDAQHGMFVTAVYAVLSLGTGELAYANAGHNLPLLLRADAWELERLHKGGMALGVLEGARLREHVVSLEPGDSLVFYTDGITEAFSPEGEMYGEERLRATIQAAGGGSAQAMLEAIDGSVLAFVGDASPSDDRTLVVLRCLK